VACACCTRSGQGCSVEWPGTIHRVMRCLPTPVLTPALHESGLTWTIGPLGRSVDTLHERRWTG
jgi:hypothetical protein